MIAKALYFSAALSLLACTTPAKQQMASKILDSNNDADTSKEDVCEGEVYECSAYQIDAPYLCSAYYQNDRVMAWGPSPCLARQNLFQKSCKSGIPFKKLQQLSCIPDPSRGECPTQRKPCSFESKPTVCRATSYEGRKLSWDLMPSAWGSNECVARQKLQEEACHTGLVPSLMGDIQCEADISEGACPPKRDCEESPNDKPVVCSVEQFGNQKLEKPWTVFAPSQCQAMKQIQLLACRYASHDNQLKPSDLGPVHCETSK